MPVPGEITPNPIEANIKALYVETNQSYRAFLEDTGVKPYPLVDAKLSSIHYSGYSLYSTVASKLLQQHGVRVRINFLEEREEREPGDGHLYRATTSYASPSEKQRRNVFFSRLNTYELGIPEGALFDGLGTLDRDNESLTLAAALRSGDRPEALAEEYEQHQGLLSLYDLDPDLALRTIVHRNLLSYYKDTIGGLERSLSKLELAVTRVSQKLKPSVERETEIASLASRETLGYMSADLMKGTMEELVAEGYTPLTPEEYAQHIGRLLMITRPDNHRT